MPTVEVNPIAVSRLPGGFLDAARELETDRDWRGGVTFTSNCGGAWPWNCNYEAEKTVDDLGDPTEFLSFLIYSVARCNGAGVHDRLREAAEQKLERGTSGLLARELMLANAQPSNPSLITEAATIDESGLCLVPAVASLLSAAEDCGGGELTIHAPSFALPFFLEARLVNFIGGKYRLGGHTVIFDTYPNVTPASADVQDDPASNEVWLYATGPVEWKLGDLHEIHNRDDRRNDGVTVLERLAVVLFDPCCAWAIKAKVC